MLNVTLLGKRGGRIPLAVEPPHQSDATAASKGNVGKPRIDFDPIDYGKARKRQMANYSKRHYGQSRRRKLNNVRAIVLHYTSRLDLLVGVQHLQHANTPALERAARAVCEPVRRRRRTATIYRADAAADQVRCRQHDRAAEPPLDSAIEMVQPDLGDQEQDG